MVKAGACLSNTAQLYTSRLRARPVRLLHHGVLRGGSLARRGFRDPVRQEQNTDTQNGSRLQKATKTETVFTSAIDL